jgi:arginine repressor
MYKRLTPAQAATKVGVSRSTISRALKNMELIGTRGNNNRWAIAETDLDKWSSENVQNSVQNSSTEQDRTAHEELQRLRETSSAQSVKIEMLEIQVSDLKADRDEWRSYAKRRWWHFNR